MLEEHEMGVVPSCPGPSGSTAGREYRLGAKTGAGAAAAAAARNALSWQRAAALKKAGWASQMAAGRGGVGQGEARNEC